MDGSWGEAAVAYAAATDERVAVLELVDDELLIRAGNHALAAFFGLEPEELADQPGSRFYPPDELADVAAKVRSVSTTGEPIEYEAVRELPRGRLVVAARMVPMTGGRVLVMGVDVSRQREAEEQLARVEELAEIGVWAWNVVDDVPSWSGSYRRLHGLPEDLPPSVAAVLALVHPDDREAVAILTDEVRTQGRARPLRYRIVRPDGEVRHVEGRAEVVTDDRGAVLRVVGTVQDVTQQHALEQQQRQLREAEQRQAQALELNDDIVQELSRAWLALELEDVPTVRDIIEQTTRRVQAIVSGLLSTATGTEGQVGPGDLVRERAAGEEVSR